VSETAESGASGLKIGAIIKATGVTRATIHHYVKEGLLPEPVKTSRNMALYEPDSIDRVLLIKGLQKTFRRSLAEVKELLVDAPGHEGLARLQGLLEVESGRVQASRLNPERPSEPLGTTALQERSGFSSEEIKELETLGLIARTRGPGRKRFSPANVDVVDALASLKEGGFNAGSGFVAEDAVIYLDALRNLLHAEVSIFLGRAQPGTDPEELVTLAQAGVERVTPLLLALRRRLISEFLDAAPLPPTPGEKK